MDSHGDRRTARPHRLRGAKSLLTAFFAAIMLLGTTVNVASAASATSAWGLNDDGQLGNGSMTGPSTCLFNGVQHFCSKTPILVEELGEVTAVAAGQFHSLALLSNGTVEAWGNNEKGQLGDGTTTGSDVPGAVAGLSEVTAVAAGTTHSLALLSNGTVEAWGSNEKGQLGDGTTTNSSVPVAVSGLTEVIAIAAGGSYSVALLSSGSVEAWGANEVGQLGNGTTTNSTTPVSVSGLTEVTSIAAGFAHSLAVLSTGMVKAWGYNASGQLGDGTASGPSKCTVNNAQMPCATIPVAVTGVSDATAVAAGEQHSLAITQSGGVDAWGSNEEGQLGNGTLNGSDVPLQVSGLTEVSAIAAGGRTSMAVLQGGAVMGWGSNSYGQLGDGTTEQSDRPVSVSLCGVFGIATRGGHSLAVGSQAPVVCPTVSKVAPSSGPAPGGTSVTISGTNLAEATAVKFGKTNATSFTVESPTSIQAVSPAGSGTVDVTVTTPLGTSVTSAADRYSYVPPPTVTHVFPASGPLAGGTQVTISGTGFSGASAVDFGPDAATSFTVESATRIQAVSPAGSGTVDVTVTTQSGTSSTSTVDRFTYFEPPEFGRCIKVTAGTGGYGNSGCTIAGGERKYEWYPAFGSRPLAKLRFTAKIKELTEARLTTKGGQVISCAGETASGEFTGAKSLAGILTFTGCHLGELGKCESSGAAEGEVVTALLAGQLGVVTKGLEARKDKIGLDLKAAVGDTFAEMSCAGTQVIVSGSVIAPIGANSMSSKVTLKYAGSKGVQKPSRFEGGEEDVLLTKIGEGEAEKSALTLTTIQTNEEKVEVNSVV
jgi:alpha-tubulin suppressor-like RCC1 family protein